MTTQHLQGSGRPLARLAIIVISLILALVAVAIIAAPKIASRIASGALASIAGDALGGTADAHVSLGWRSGARVDSLIVRDDAGRELANLTIDTHLTLLDALRWNGDAGAITVSGAIVLTEDALTKATDSPRGGGQSGNNARNAGNGGVDLSGLLDFSADFTLDSLAVTIEDGAGEIVSFDDFDISASLDHGTIDLHALSASPAFDLSLNAQGFIDANGTLDIHTGTADAQLNTVLDRRAVERSLALVGVDLDAPGITVERTNSAGDTVVIRLDAQLANGRLVVSSIRGPSNLPFADAQIGRAHV